MLEILMEDKEEIGVQVSETPQEKKQDLPDSQIVIKDPFIEKVASSVAGLGETPLQAFERGLRDYTGLEERKTILSKTTNNVIRGGEEAAEDESAKKARGIS